MAALTPPPSDPRHAQTVSLTLHPPPFPHQVAGHAPTGEGGHGGFRAHQRRRRRSSTDEGSGSASQLDRVTRCAGCIPATMQRENDTSDDDADANASGHLQPTVLKPVPLHLDKGRRELHFYTQIEAMRTHLRAQEATMPKEWSNVNRCKCGSSEQQVRDAMRAWLSFFPRFYGILSLPNPSASVAPNAAASAPPVSIPVLYPHLHLSDVTSPYAHPSLLDVKMGVRSWDPFAVTDVGVGTGEGKQDEKVDWEKVVREEAKCPSQAQTGFRICGARVWRPVHAHNGSSTDQSDVAPCGGSYASFNKKWGRAAKVEQIEHPFWTFMGHEAPDTNTSAPAATTFTPGARALRTASLVLPVYIARLRTLLDLCLRAPLWRFYASSILFSYEIMPGESISAPAMDPTSGAAEVKQLVRADVHLIDFGHVYPIHQPLPPMPASAPDAAQVASAAHTPGTAPSMPRIDVPRDTALAASVASNATCSGCGLPPTPVDDNYVHGVRSLLAIFERMLTRAQESRKEGAS